MKEQFLILAFIKAKLTICKMKYSNWYIYTIFQRQLKKSSLLIYFCAENLFAYWEIMLFPVKCSDLWTQPEVKNYSLQVNWKIYEQTALRDSRGKAEKL